MVVDEWKRNGGEVVRVSRFWARPEVGGLNVRCYGGDMFCLTLAESLGLELISPPEDLLLRLARRWTCRAMSQCRLDEVERRRFPLFAKSRSVQGLFRSGVFLRSEDLRRECWGLPADTEVLVSEVAPFDCEARAFVADRRVLDCAVYRGEGSVGEARRFAEELVAEVKELPEVVVIDVGRLQDSRWAIVEANPAWGSALRGCSVEKVIRCIAGASRPAAA
jgi:hypothetical protein